MLLSKATKYISRAFHSKKSLSDFATTLCLLCNACSSCFYQ